MRLSPRHRPLRIALGASWLSLAGCSLLIDLDERKYIGDRAPAGSTGGIVNTGGAMSSGGQPAADGGTPSTTITGGLGGMGGTTEEAPATGGEVGEPGSGGREGSGGVGNAGGGDALGTGGQIEPMLPDPVHYYALNSTAGTQAVDDGIAATLLPGVVTDENAWVPALVEGGWELRGPNDYLQLSKDVLGPSYFSLSFWVTRVSDQTCVLVHKAGANNEGGFFLLQQNRRLTLYHGGEGAASPLTSMASLPPAEEGKWSHLVITFGRSEDGTLDHLGLWLDAQPVIDQMTLFSQDTPRNTTSVVRFGRIVNNQYPSCGGVLDEVRIYTDELLPEEISLLYDRDRLGLARSRQAALAEEQL